MARLEKYEELFKNHPVKLHNGYTMDQALNEVREFIKTNEGTLDSTAARTFLARFLIAQGEYKELDSVFKSLELTGDNLVDFFILIEKSIYNLGIHNPVIDLILSETQYKQAQSLTNKMKFQDDWEQSIVRVYTLWRGIWGSNTESEIINLLDQIDEIIKTHSELGFIKYRFLGYLGVPYRKVGKLDLAIKTHQTAFDFFSKSDFSLLYVSYLVDDYINKSELTKAEDILSDTSKTFDRCTNYWLKDCYLNSEARILELQQKFEELEQNLIQHVVLANKHNNDLKTFEINLDLFSFYFKRFKSTNNNRYRDKIRNTRRILNEIALKNKEELTIKRLNSYAEAMLFGLGSIKKKAKAVEIYEELNKIYSNDPKFKLNLIELYWNDLEYDIEGESKKEIDKLIDQLQNFSVMKTQALDNTIMSYKIFLAKYDFYINGNTKQALDSLYAKQALAVSYGYKVVEEMLNKEIKLLENNIAWESLEPSYKERINKFKLESYIEGAQTFLNNDFNTA